MTSRLLPSDKMDTERAEALVALGFPAVEPVISSLLEWMQDMNWPVAQVLQPFLAKIGAPLAPHIRNVLVTDDVIWKYWVLRRIIGQSTELANVLQPELKRLASNPTSAEQKAELEVLASEILGRLR